MFKMTSVMLRNSAAKSQATAQKLLAKAQAIQSLATEQQELAVTVEAKEHLVALQLQLASLRLNCQRVGAAFMEACADRAVAETTLVTLVTKVEDTRKVSETAMADVDIIQARVCVARAEIESM